MAAKNLKKLSVATVFGQIPLERLVTQKRIHCMSIMGQAVGIKEGTKVWGDGDIKPWTALQGVFKAINPDTKEEFRGATLFLPDVALVPLKVGMVDMETGSFRTVRFALNLYADFVPDEKRRAGGSVYEYSFESVLPEDAAHDPIALIEAQIARQLALAAPSGDVAGSNVAAIAGQAKGKK
jgi:hypothetical protein